eukprot:TRINITY_DN365_c0_g1_i7.p1 TRINITY_DN365_c0_g1~~TRINITY_DN365_c0_g1_i7.p1  ORF type:complete len:4455 (+),score=2004.27 TRINITY_DN365_c0_g1_i7:138-13502(+)
MSQPGLEQELDQQWLVIKEESLLFNEGIVDIKYNDLDESKNEDEQDKQQDASKKSKRDKEKQDHDLAYKLVGLVDVDRQQFNKKAISQWTKELLTACAVSSDSSSSFENALKKRLRVQKYLHSAYMRDKLRKKRAKPAHGTRVLPEHEGQQVPVVVRLGVLTLFPLLESLSRVPGVQYQQLCKQTLDMIIGVISALPPLALREEPQDCLDAFNEFIHRLIRDYEYRVDADYKAQAVTALIGLAVSRGEAHYLLRVIDVLFNIVKRTALSDESAMRDVEVGLKIGTFLKQLDEYKRDQEHAVMTERGLESTWYIDTQLNTTAESQSTFNLSKAAQQLVASQAVNGIALVSDHRTAALASDGAYLYLHETNQGLFKIGTGLMGTIRGHIYHSRNDYHSSDHNTSLASVQGAVWYLSSTLMPSPAVSSSDESPHETEDTATTVSETVPKTPLWPTLALLTSSTLEEACRVQLTNSSIDAANAVLISDGRYLYLLGKKKDNRAVNTALLPATSASSVRSEEQRAAMTRQDEESSSDSGSDEDDEPENEEEEGSDNEGNEPAEYQEPVAWEQQEGDEQAEEDSPPVPAEPVRTSDGTVHVEQYDCAQWSAQDRALIDGAAALVRRFELKTSDQTQSVSSVWERSLVYTNGAELVLVGPQLTVQRKGTGAASLVIPNNTVLNRARLYSLQDGKYMAEVAVSNEPWGLTLNYDTINRRVWSYLPSNKRVMSWIDLSPPCVHETAEHSTLVKYSPEEVLSRDEYKLELAGKARDSFPALNTLLVLLSHMNRLARQHPAYHVTRITDTEPHDNEDESHYYFAVQSSPHVIKLLQSIVQHSLECMKLNPEMMSYTLLACLRLLRVNMHELITHERDLNKCFESAQLDMKSIATTLRELLQRFVDDDQVVVTALRHQVREEAMNVLVTGFIFFYPSSTAQIECCLALLSATSEGSRQLCNQLVLALAEWYRVGDVLTDDAVKESGAALKESTKGKELTAPSLTAHPLSGKFLAQLIAYTAAQVQLTQPHKAELLLTPAVKLLLSLQREVLLNTWGRQVTLEYCDAVLDRCTHLVTALLAAPPSEWSASYDTTLRCSLLGVVLPSMVTALCRPMHVKDTQLVSGVVPKLIPLIKQLDQMCRQVAAATAADQRYLRRLSNKKDKRIIIETKHPYPHGKNQFRETVSIPGAAALSIRFDPRSRTMSPTSDVLQLFASPKLDRPVLKDGAPLFFSGNNFPKQSIVIKGDTLTFVFNASTRPDPNNVAQPQRWGFKCIVSEVSGSAVGGGPAIISHWLLELENSITLLAAKCAATLIEGEAQSDREKSLQPWLETRLLNGGLEEGSAVAVQSFIEQFIDEQGPASKLYEWIKTNKGRAMLPPLAKKPLERAERVIIAAILKQMGLIAEAQQTVQLLTEGKEPTADTQGKLQLISKKSQQVVSWLMRRGQMQKEWQIAVQEKPSDTSVFDGFRQDQQRLMELCELKGVEFDLMDTNETVKRLWNKLQEEITASTASDASAMQLDTPQNPYEVIAMPVIERARLLLRVVPAMRRVRSPSADSANPFAGPRDHKAHALRASQRVPSRDDSELSQQQSLSRSMLLPQTDATLAKERQRAHEEQKNKDFSQRVKALRKWLQAYKSWKEWQDSALLANKHGLVRLLKDEPPRSPLQGVISFVMSALSVKELERIFKLHTTRARSRVQGLHYLQQLLSACSFGSVRHQVLGSLGKPLATTEGGHYLDNIQTCGEELSHQVSEAFVGLFERMTALLSDATLDLTSRLLALNICGLSYQHFDVQLLMRARVFPLLRQIIAERLAMSTSTTVRVRLSDEEVNMAGSGGIELKEKQEEEEELAEVQKRQNTLRLSAWTAFRLLATQVVHWSLQGDDPSGHIIDRSAISKLQDQIFDLMCDELKRISEHLIARPSSAPSVPNPLEEDTEEQCYQLLSLLHLLGTSSSRLKSLSRKENIDNLLSLLHAQSSPRTQRLVLRLCRRLLPLQHEGQQQLIDKCLAQIGKWLFHGKFVRSDRVKTANNNNTNAANTNEDAMQVESSAATNNAGSESDDEEDQAAKKRDMQYVVSLNTWLLGHKRLVETCVNAFGADFFNAPPPQQQQQPQLALGAAFFGRLAQQNTESKAQEVVAEMNATGSAQLRTGTLDQCNKLAQAITLLGGSVTIAPVQGDQTVRAASEEEHKNKQKLVDNPIYWINGHSAEGLASEYINLLRTLTGSRQASWLNALRAGVVSALNKLSELYDRISTATPAELTALMDYYHIALAALCVLGGFDEDIRVGGRVQIKSNLEGRRRGTVVEYQPHMSTKAEVVFDDEENSHPSPHRLSVQCLVALVEQVMDAQFYTSIMKDALPHLMSLIRKREHKKRGSQTHLSLVGSGVVSDNNVNTNNAAQTHSHLRWLLSELEMRALSAVSQYLTHCPDGVQLVLKEIRADKFTQLIDLAKSCDPAAHVTALEQQQLLLQQRLWNTITMPGRESSELAKPMVKILPHFPHNHKADFLPTCFDRTNRPGVIFIGKELRTVEFTSFGSNAAPVAAPRGVRGSLFGSYGRGGRAAAAGHTETIVPGNVMIPAHLSEYYFEVTIDAIENNSSIISIGLCPEGQTTWGNGSYRFQANKIKTWYVNGQRKQEAYGAYYAKAKTVIGCGWNQDEQTIYFTMDGEDLGPAFHNVFPNNERVVPAVAGGKSVRMSINFGQEPFRFNLTASAALDEVTKEKKRLEADERRRKAQEEEEARRKKQKDDEDRAIQEAAGLLIGMGYDMKKARKALEMTGFNGAEPAVMWLLENPDFNFEDEDESKDKAEDKKEAEPPKDESTKPSSEDQMELEQSEEQSAALKEVPDEHEDAEQSYQIGLSAQCVLHDDYCYLHESDKDKAASGPSVASDWEDRIIPELKAFMERDGFSRFEVSEYLQQMRNQLAVNNEDEARNIVVQILGEAANTIRFPNKANAPGTAGASNVQSLKMDQLRIGTTLLITECEPAEQSAAVNKYWLKPMTRTMGRMGVIKSVDHQNNLALLQLYDSERGRLEEWWYPVQLLNKPSKELPLQSLQTSKSVEADIKTLIGIQQTLARCYARRLVLQVLNKTAVTAESEDLTQLIKLSAHEYLASTDITSTAHALTATLHDKAEEEDDEHAKHMNQLHRQLQDLLALLQSAGNVDKVNQFVHYLTKFAVDTLESARHLTTKRAVTVTSAEPQPAAVPVQPPTSLTKSNKAAAPQPVAAAAVVESQEQPTQKVHVEGARCLYLVFDRSTFFPAGSQAKLQLYYDEECTQLIHSYAEKGPFYPLLVTANRLYVKLSCKSQAAQCKYKMYALPIGPDFALARWLIEFLLLHTIPLQSDLTALFNGCVDFMYRSKSPSVFKEALFLLVAEMIHRLRETGESGRAVLKQLPLARLYKLKQELTAQHETERKRGTLFSSYLQCLLELVVAYRLYEIESAPPSESTASSIEGQESELGALFQSSSDVPQPITPAKEESKPAESKPSESSEPLFDEDMDDELAAAIKASLAQPPQSEEKKEDKPAEPSVSAEKTEDKPTEPQEDVDMGDLSDDEDLQAALELSKQALKSDEKSESADKKEPVVEKKEPLAEDKKGENKKGEDKKGENKKGEDKKGENKKGEDKKKEKKSSPEPKQSAKKKSRSNSVKQDKAVDQADPQWLSALLDLARSFEGFAHRDTKPESVLHLVRAAWPETQKDWTRERLVVLEGLPKEVIKSKPEELKSSVEDWLEEVSALRREGGQWLDDVLLVELHNSDKTRDFVTKINKLKFKPSKALDIKTALTLKATAFRDLESSDPKLVQLYRTKLVTTSEPPSLTAKAAAALTEVFNRFAVKSSSEANVAVMSATELDLLQQSSVGEKITEETVKFLLEHYETKSITVGDRQVTGITLKGFLAHYQQQSIETPSETMAELIKLGYDVHLNQRCYTTEELALNAIKQFTPHPLFDEDIVRHAEQLYIDCELSTPLALNTSHIGPFDGESHLAQQYPRLARVELTLVRLRFEMLRQFNQKLSQLFALINFTAQGRLATYFHHCRALIFHAVKMQFFYDVLDKTSLQVPQPVVTIDRLKLAARKEKEPQPHVVDDEYIHKNTAFGIAFKQLRHIDPALFRQKKPGGAEPHFSLKIDFKGEHVEGEGGPYRQYFTDVSRELRSVLPLFIPCPNAQAKLGKNRDKFIPNPSCQSRLHMKMYRMIGHMMGMAIRTGVKLTVDLPAFFWKPLVGSKLTVDDLKEIDHSLYGFLRFMRICAKEDLEGDNRKIFEKFTISRSDKSVVPLKPGGQDIDVTWANKEEYIRLVEQSRLHESRMQLKAIKQGLSEVVPAALLQLCSWQDLEWRVCGKPMIDVKLLKRHTEYSGVSAQAPHVSYFWSVMRAFSADDKRAFVRFAWAQERLPADDQEFERTQTRMLIKPFTGLANPDNAFPKADTCFFNLMLPEYSSANVLRQKLLFAIHTDADSMDADVRPPEDQNSRNLANQFIY